jgi:hypothetical protein
MSFKPGLLSQHITVRKCTSAQLLRQHLKRKTLGYEEERVQNMTLRDLEEESFKWISHLNEKKEGT